MGFQVKIVGDFCNIRCAYCRNRDFNRTEKAIMSVETLEKLLAFLNSLPQKEVRVNWHGGEPLLAGKDFFKHIVRLEKEYPDKRWRNAVQTNATLIDADWAKFFSENGFHVGVSIDGNERVHNIDRINARGHGTYKRAMRGVDILRQHDIHPGVICTVTKKTVKHAEEIFLGLVSAGFKNISFNAFYNTASEDLGDSYGLSDKEWLLFLIEIFETWLAFNDPTVRVREVDGILAWTESKVSNCCVYKGNCHQWFAVDDLGNFYPCERFGKAVCFGDLGSLETFGKLATSSMFLEWKKSLKALPKKCQLCDLQLLCNNGCSRHRQADIDGIPVYVYCKSRLGFYAYVQNKLKQKGGEMS